MSKLKQFIAHRQTHIFKITELKQIAEDALTDTAKHENFKCRFSAMDEIKASFEKQHDNVINIISTLEDGDLDAEFKIQSGFDSHYFHIHAVYKQLFDNKKAELDTSLNSTAKPNVKLPKIGLPQFNGNISQWQTFFDSYRTLVHENDCLANIEKFNYLLQCLSGEPFQLIKATPLSDSNYLIAYNNLVKRYNNTRIIATAHWHALESTKKLCGTEGPDALRSLVDTFHGNITILENMQFPVEHWDFILFTMLFDRLDKTTATRFELSNNISPDTKNSFNILIKFLDRQCDVQSQVLLSGSLTSKSADPPIRKQHVSNKSITSTSLTTNAQLICPLCKADHLIYHCPSFVSKSPQERFSCVKTNKWCVNCLGHRHSTDNCSSQGVCRKCSKKHHTMLHFPPHSQNTQTASGASQSNLQTSPLISATRAPQGAISTSTTLLSSDNSLVLLSTAVVHVLDGNGQFTPVRALIDSASDSNYISSRCARRLGSNRRSSNISVCGIGETSAHSSQIVTSKVKPCLSPVPTFELDFIVLPKICSSMPSLSLGDNVLSDFSNLTLADPKFHLSGPIEMLLGADIFGYILKGCTINNTSNGLVAIDTVFGWVITGKLEKPCPSVVSHTFLSHSDLSLEKLVNKFWELEQVPSSQKTTPEEILAESHYSDTVTRLTTGRFVVSLPFKNGQPSFEGTREQAIRRFMALERRLYHEPELHAQYSEFMMDYLTSGHMSIVPSDIPPNSLSYYIPHHSVVKSDSSTTKLRVVFDASAKDQNNRSLNDVLLPGPKLQQDLALILLKFRLHAVVFTADVKQMFRQILVGEEDRSYQMILWRFSRDNPLQTFALNTVTYGMNCSPFLAIRSLLQLAKDFKSEFPIASEILENDIYVDDILSGTDSLQTALHAQQELISLLQKGCFELRKWASNHSGLLTHLPSCSLPFPLDSETESTIKILGLQWSPSSDNFIFKTTPLRDVCTKRSMLSDLARIFDPLGFLTPLTFYLKFLIQQLWARNTDWDTPPSDDILLIWNQFKDELPAIQDIRVQRHIIPQNYTSLELHGFCDASSRGYAAVIYLRSTLPSGAVQINLVCAKSKISPLKQISIPRLELCAALLLSELMKFVLSHYEKHLTISGIYAWSDSTITLSWINSLPHRWGTFVSNRLTKLQDNLPSTIWRHVSTQDNPADPASRGLLPRALVSNSMWFSGPQWLSQSSFFWPTSSEIPETDEEKRRVTLTGSDTRAQDAVLSELIERYSSLGKIERITAYILRFIYNLKHPHAKKTGYFSRSELENALTLLIKHVQCVEFALTISRLNSHKPLPRSFKKLTPFLDGEGVLRVGGRLGNSYLPYSQQHPCLLPNKHRLVHLIIDHTHKVFLHPGLQTLHYLLSQRYWILAGKRAIKRVLSKCHACFRASPTVSQPLMGDLPTARVAQIKPFSKVGVDFAGPFFVTLGKRRGIKSQKAWICLFVCMATKCIHLELVSSLSTEAFLAAFRRFTSRRGTCTDIYSDCGTNFVGAAKHLANLMKTATSTHEHVSWHFNPPASPNFGGLFEAGVKSVKYHLTRVVGIQILTYEELNTVLIQIEAVLNSRPLCPMSSDPRDLSVLTPGHFLTLSPLNSPPDEDVTEIPIGRLSRWQLLLRMHQDFWRRWHQEYLHTLLQRSKWFDPAVPITEGTLVLLKEGSSPPQTWHIARVEQIHPGKDGITRVVTVRTAKGSFKRPVSKVCPLPLN